MAAGARGGPRQAMGVGAWHSLLRRRRGPLARRSAAARGRCPTLRPRSPAQAERRPGGRLAARVVACSDRRGVHRMLRGMHNGTRAAPPREPRPPEATRPTFLSSEEHPSVGLDQVGRVCGSADQAARQGPSSPPPRAQRRSRQAPAPGIASAPSHPPLASHCQWAGYNVQIAGMK